ncbi:hypothetical protein [Lacrimispora sp. 38-1]|uniref:hypothetical protein n=1 Tax=Lacrimispora sp. 38-1 TaxID=3125778 RepID=UPI003CF7D99E
MSADAELLNFIYQNSQMGVETLHQLLPMTDNEAFKKQLHSQLKEYTGIHEEAKELLNKNGCKEKEIGQLQKVMTYFTIDMKTMVDKSASHMAEMLILGSVRGIIDCIKRIRQYEGEAEKEIVELMKRLLKFEENNMERLKEFL